MTLRGPGPDGGCAVVFVDIRVSRGEHMSEGGVIRSVSKVMDIFQYFRDCGRVELSITELSQALKMPKSTVCRLAKTLQSYGCLTQNPQNGRYSLGLKLFELGSQVPHIKELRDVSFFHMEQLRQATDSTIHMAILDQKEVLFIVKVQAKATAELNSGMGHRAPAHCTAVGKVLLAYQPEHNVRTLLGNQPLERHTGRTICDYDLLCGELATVQEKGYAVDNGEYQEMCLCVAYPLRQYDGAVVAALSISQITAVVNDDKIQTFSSLCRITAANISRELGYRSSAPDSVAVWT